MVKISEQGDVMKSLFLDTVNMANKATTAFQRSLKTICNK